MAEALIDFENAMERLGDDKEFLIELLNELIEQVNSSQDSLKAAVEEKNYDELRFVAHGLKGAAANLDVSRMARIFKSLEDMGAQNNTDGAENLIKEAEESNKELAVFLENI